MNANQICNPSRTAAFDAIRAMGLTPRQCENTFTAAPRRKAYPFVSERDLGALVMIARAVQMDDQIHGIGFNAAPTEAGKAAAVIRDDEGREYGFTGPDWEPTAGTRFYCQRGAVFGFGATPYGALADLTAKEERAATEANAAAAEVSFIESHAAPLPPALTVESALAAEMFGTDSRPAEPNELALSPSDMFATVYDPDGRPVATVSRPPYIGDSGLAKGLYRLTLTDGRLVGAFRVNPPVRSVRKALAEYAAESNVSDDHTVEGLRLLALNNFRNARDNMESPFRGSSVGRAARLARRAACEAARPAPCENCGGRGYVQNLREPVPCVSCNSAAYDAPRLPAAAPTGDCACELCGTDFDSLHGTIQICPECYPAERATAEAREEAAAMQPQPCQQQQARAGVPLSLQAAPHGPRLAPQVRVWGVALVPPGCSLRPVPRVDGRATWQGVINARAADKFAIRESI